MTLAIWQNCSRRVLIIKDFLCCLICPCSTSLKHSILERSQDFIWSNEKNQQHFENGKMAVLVNTVLVKTVLETTDSLCKQLRWQEKCFFPGLAWLTSSSLTPQPSGSLLCPPHCNPCHPQSWGSSALPPWQPLILYTTAAEWPNVHSPTARELWSGHCKLCTPEVCKKRPPLRRHIL